MHPNTVRFYEKMELLPVIPRTQNGYRVYTDEHLSQLRLLRIAFRAEIISDKLRQEVYEIIKTVARGDVVSAYEGTEMYLNHLREEKARAEEAIQITMNILDHNRSIDDQTIECNGRQDAADLLDVTVDVLRGWERNGLLTVKRYSNGYTKYSKLEINRLKIIKTLRNAHYSMMSILRMLNRLDQGDLNILENINTPGEQEDIVSATDRYITALNLAEVDAQQMLAFLQNMQKP